MKKNAKAAAKKQCLILAGGWDGHEPFQCTDIFMPWLESKGFKVRREDNLDILLNKRVVNKCSLIIPAWTMGQITPEQSKALREAILAGCGLGGWHGGMCDAFRNDSEYQFMTGGQFVCHPGGIIDHTINITNEDDPITRGLNDFKLKSEQYFMHVDPSNEVLATTTFSGRHAGVNWIKGTVMPAVWKRSYGKGRVFYCAPGHVAGDFENPTLTEIVKRGLLWAARQRVSPQDI